MTSLSLPALLGTAALQDINSGIFRKRFEQLLEKKSLTDSDDQELSDLRILLCISVS